MKLFCIDGFYTEDAKKCSDMLNDVFGSPFCAQLNADKSIYARLSQESIEVTIDGVMKLLNYLKSGKCYRKMVHVAPLHKKGATDQHNNYRPISFTSVLCKLLEHIVLHHLHTTLDAVLYNRQHGFR